MTTVANLMPGRLHIDMRTATDGSESTKTSETPAPDSPSEKRQIATVMDKALRKAIKAAGGLRPLARKLGIKAPSIVQWRSVPPLRVLEVERITKISRHDLRPDLYPRDEIMLRTKHLKLPPTLAESHARLAKRLSAMTAERDALWKRLNAADKLAMRLALELATLKEQLKERG